MKSITVEVASKLMCPETISSGNVTACATNKCMAWEIVIPAMEREDHSGAHEMMRNLEQYQFQPLLRKGPPGSNGKLYFEEMGICNKLR